MPKTSLATRLHKLTRRDPKTGCLRFTGGMNSRRPYALIASDEDGRKPLLIHRASWEIHHRRRIDDLAPAKDGTRWEVHHRCHDKLCCEPSHLQLVTRREHSAIHTFERRWNKALSKIAPYGYIPASFAEAA